MSITFVLAVAMTARTVRTALTVVLVGSCALAASAEDVVGRFQFVSAVTAMSRETAGIMRMTLEAPKAVDVSDKDASRLSLLFDIRVTRADGTCGTDSLKLVQGGGVSMTDPAGNEVFRAGSPVSEGVAPIMRRAGAWMSASFPLAKMKSCGGGIGTLFLSLYNDLPKHGVPCGVSVEVRNARIVEASAEELGLASEKDAKENPRPRTVCNPIDLEYMIQRRKQRKGGSFEPVMTESADPARVRDYARYTPESVAAYKAVAKSAARVWLDKKAKQLDVNRAVRSFAGAKDILKLIRVPPRPLATLLDGERSVEAHHLCVSLPAELDLTGYADYRVIVRYEVKFETTHATRPKDAGWLKLVVNGKARVWGEGTVKNETAIDLAPLNCAKDSALAAYAKPGTWMTLVHEVPVAKLPGAKLARFEAYLFNDTGVKMTVRNVQVLTDRP